jgi:hypothetical protein
MTEPKRSPSNPQPEIPAPPRRGDEEKPHGDPVSAPPRPEIPSESPKPEIPAKPERDLPQPDRERA